MFLLMALLLCITIYRTTFVQNKICAHIIKKDIAINTTVYTIHAEQGISRKISHGNILKATVLFNYLFEVIFS